MFHSMNNVVTSIKKFRTEFAFGIIIVSLYTISHIPYVNIFLSSIMSVIVTGAVIIAVGIQGRTLYLTSIRLFLVVLFFTLIGEKDVAEYLGNAIYFILMIATLSTIVNLKARSQ